MSNAVRSAAQAEKDAIVFKALANPVRLQIVSLVAASPEGQVSAGHIVERFSLSQPTISHHLRVLREAGVLTTYKSSTFVYYRFAPQLHDTVTSILPDAAAAQPPADTTPARRTAASKTTPRKAAARPAAASATASETAKPQAQESPQPEPQSTPPIEAHDDHDDHEGKKGKKKDKKSKKGKKGKKK